MSARAVQLAPFQESDHPRANLTTTYQEYHRKLAWHEAKLLAEKISGSSLHRKGGREQSALPYPAWRPSEGGRSAQEQSNSYRWIIGRYNRGWNS
ncbi:MAG: hypothetical protein M1281_15280 [Chloroflexi bacterium]|nr:hypothetical protein [Chloroflexota bacterium]